jgi:hypothetical protein
MSNPTIEVRRVGTAYVIAEPAKDETHRLRLTAWEPLDGHAAFRLDVPGVDVQLGSITHRELPEWIQKMRFGPARTGALALCQEAREFEATSYIARAFPEYARGAVYGPGARALVQYRDENDVEDAIAAERFAAIMGTEEEQVAR